METKCCGILGRIFGHKFQARMSTYPADISGLKLSGNISDMLFHLQKRVYECDVCVRCGAVVNKKKSA